MFKRKFLARLAVVLLVLSLFAGTGTAASSDVTFEMRVANISKTVSDIFPSRFLSALNLISADIGIEEAVKAGLIIDALANSNLRTLAAQISLGKDNQVSKIGGVVTVDGADEFFARADETGKFSLFELLKIMGGQQLVDLLESLGGKVYSLSTHNFARDGEGVFVHEDNYIIFKGNAIISYEFRDDTIEAAKNFAREKFDGDANFALQIPKNLNRGNADLTVKIAMSHVGNMLRLGSSSNAFEVYPWLAKKFERKADIPAVGDGEPLYAFGGISYIDSVQEIEDGVMAAGDDRLTAHWANIIASARRFGLSKEDIGNLFAGSFAFVFGLDEKIAGLPLPLGGYLALTGKDGAARKVLDAAIENFAGDAVIIESKIDGWDNVYTFSPELNVPNVVALKNETILVGLLSPENLAKPINLGAAGGLSLWMDIGFEKIWNTTRTLFKLKELFEGIFGKTNGKIDAAAGELLATEFPVKNFGFWFESPEKFSVDFLSNPAATAEFWLNLLNFVQVLGTENK